MVSWIVRLILAGAGTVTGWFVATDSTSFQLVQFSIAALLIALVVFVLAFWPRQWSRRLNGLRKGSAP
jgi:hypothetical protein